MGVVPAQTGSSGALVERVESGTPAASAGLVAGDVITSLDARGVTTPAGLTTLLQLYHPGDKVRLGWRDASGASHIAWLRLAVGPAA